MKRFPNRRDDLKSNPILRYLLVPIGVVGIVGFTIILHSVLKNNILGADFYTFYLAGSAVVGGEDPYSEEVTRAAQIGIYGRLAEVQEDQVGFAYPIFALLPGLFIFLLSHDWAYAFWLSMNLVILLACLLWVFHGSRLVFAPFTLAAYPVFFGLILGNFSILLLCIFLVYWKLVLDGKYLSPAVQVAVGLMLSWATIKPQFVWLILILSLLVAFRRGWKLLIAGFLGGLTFWWLLSFAVQPTWMVSWIQRVQEYAVYTHTEPTIGHFLRLLFSSNLREYFTPLFIAALLVIAAWLCFRVVRGDISPLPALASVGVITYLVHPHPISYEQLTFFIPLLLWIRYKFHLPTALGLIGWLVWIFLTWLPFGLRTGSDAVNSLPVIPAAIWSIWLLQRQKDYNTLARYPSPGFGD